LHQRQLPPEFRQIGDEFVRSEFRQHKNITDEKILNNFFNEWEKVRNFLYFLHSPPTSFISVHSYFIQYFHTLRTQTNDLGFGAKMSGETLSDLSGEQAIRMLTLKDEIDKSEF
jgi:hypothetical protein